MLTLIKPNTETDTDLAWRKSLKPGDEVTVEYHDRYGVCYLMFKVEGAGKDIIDLYGCDSFMVETGFNEDYRPGLDMLRLIRPTAEIRERSNLAETVARFLSENTDFEIFYYLPLPLLRQIAAITGIKPDNETTLAA